MASELTNSHSGFAPTGLRREQLLDRVHNDASSRDEFALKLLIVSLFIPEGFSFFIGDFRLSVTRVLVILFATKVMLRMGRRQGVRLASDNMMLISAVWMLLAGAVTEGFSGMKGAGILAIEFVGTYLAFRYLTPSGASVRIVRFACKVVVVIVGLAFLDVLTGRLFTYETVKGLTGYVKPSYEAALAAYAESLFRDGAIRAMGPLEHSILFGAVCAWWGTLAFFVFPGLFGWTIAGAALFGILISQARAPLLGFAIGIGLVLFYAGTRSFPHRWKVLGALIGLLLMFIFSFSGSPIATLMKLGGISPEAAWYRQAIWDTAVPLIMQSPVFGIGVSPDWDWGTNSALIGDSVDAFWLRIAMMYGIPGAIFIFAAMVSAFWGGPIDKWPAFSSEERRLSVALGVATVTAVFLGFTVHFWGATWIMLAIFPALRAVLVEQVLLCREVR